MRSAKGKVCLNVVAIRKAINSIKIIRQGLKVDMLVKAGVKNNISRMVATGASSPNTPCRCLVVQGKSLIRTSTRATMLPRLNQPQRSSKSLYTRLRSPGMARALPITWAKLVLPAELLARKAAGAWAACPSSPMPCR